VTTTKAGAPRGLESTGNVLINLVERAEGQNPLLPRDAAALS
jgi:hypothetical protein